MYYCLMCDVLHEQLYPGKIFTTGFITFPNHERFPLGFCQWKNSTEQVIMGRRREHEGPGGVLGSIEY
jgi:hypothetical protein